MFGPMCGVRRSKLRRKFICFGNKCALSCRLFLVLSFFFFKKGGKEVRLSLINLAGVGYNVGVDVRLERDTEKSLFPFCFLFC